jgi:phosphoribosylanthranilate isomerase
MKSCIIQVYEIRTPEQARRAAALAIDHAGLWAASRPVSTALDFAAAREVFARFPQRMKRVVLTLTTDEDEIHRIIENVNPDIVHVGTLPGKFSPDQSRRIKARHPNTALMRSIPVSDEEAIRTALDYEGIADFLLLDTYDRDAENFGATGKPHDWKISRRIARTVSTPVILAGGLSPANVGEAIRAVGPAGVDTKSRTDKPGTHDKDFEALARFIENARKTVSLAEAALERMNQ